MTEVSRHQRRTASGKTTTVRKHHRDTGGPEYADPAAPAFTAEQASALAGDPAPPEESWWAEDEPVVSPAEERRGALREAGYDGPIDEDGHPASRAKLFKALLRAEREQDGAQERFSYARTIPERDAAERDYEAAKERFETLRNRGDAPAPKRRSAAAAKQQPTPEAERMAQEMRDWRALPEPQPSPAEPMDPQLAKALGCDTPEGLAKYERGRAYREAGYTGPLDRDSRIPDPDDPAQRPVLAALASMRERCG